MKGRGDDSGRPVGQGRALLRIGGALSAAIALLHVGIVFAGPAAYRYFGAGEELARRAEAGSAIPAAITLGVAAVFVLFAIYAFSGAGDIRRWPLLRTGLIAIGGIFLLRGVALIPQLLAAGGAASPESRQLVFSGVSLLVGLAYLVGAVRAWPRLSRSTASSSGPGAR